MDFISAHPGITYMATSFIGLVAHVVIAGALVSIAISLRNNKKEK